jgi:hypothetical protein
MAQIRSWPKTKNDCAHEAQQQFIGQDLTMTMVSIQSRHRQTYELKDQITESLPSNGHLRCASDFNILAFRHHVTCHTCLYDTVMANSSGSITAAFRSSGVMHRHTDSKVISQI